jgi:hypothetical protein
MNNLGIFVEAARDGGLVVKAMDGEEWVVVFAGNQKEVNDYIAKRVGEVKPTQDPKLEKHGSYLAYNDAMQREANEVLRQAPYRVRTVELSEAV